VIDFLNSLLLIFTTLAGLWLIANGGADSTIGVAALAMALPMALQATFQSGWIMFEVSGISENLGRVQDTIDTLAKPHKVVDKKDAPDLRVENNKADIAFKNVSFNYGQAVGTDGPILENFSLDIPAGQKVGLVGRSGAGKTTVTGLLVRAHDIPRGEILVAGQNIADVTQDSLRRHITVVTQDSYLFHRSVRDNIAYGFPDATQEQIEEAARRANAHEFILKLEDNRGRKGYDAHVGERGVKLSGGQRQRVSIARAILKPAPILILDEATSALDSESEHAIQDALEDIMQDKTVIAIAHRLSTLRLMDRIIVMDAGVIIEDGSHDELIRRKNGHYAMLWSLQSGGFLAD
jgi:ATP-binding cassette subfamily B multidrug efflux pump